MTTPLFQQLQHGRRKLRRVEERSELNEFASDFGSASAASLLLNLEAVATAAIAWTVFREDVDKRVGAGFAFILLGGVLLSLPQDGSFALSDGALLIAAACLCWGIDNNLTRKISGSDPSQIAMWKGLTAGSVNTGLALATGAKLPAMSIILAVAAIGFFSYGVSLVLFVRALRHLGTARTGAYFSTAPFAGTALAFAIGQGRLDRAFCAAGILMLIGVWLHVTERHEHLHVHEPLEHEHLHYHDEHRQHEHSPGDPQGEPHAHRHRHEQLTMPTRITLTSIISISTEREGKISRCHAHECLLLRA